MTMMALFPSHPFGHMVYIRWSVFTSSVNYHSSCMAWVVNIHRSHGLTLDKVVIDIGKGEFYPGITFVACSCENEITGITLQPDSGLLINLYPTISSAYLSTSRKTTNCYFLNLTQTLSCPAESTHYLQLSSNNKL